MKEDEKRIADLLVLDSDLTETEIRQFYRDGESKDLDFALEKRIIHEIKAVEIPKDVNHIIFGTPKGKN